MICSDMKKIPALLPFALLCLVLSALGAHAVEKRVASPDGALNVVFSDDQGLYYRVEIGGKLVLTNSLLGLEFKDGAKLGPAAVITKAATKKHEGTWENPFGNRRIVRDDYWELRLTLRESGDKARTFGLIVHAYDGGVAFRYDLPESSGLGNFVLTKELTEFHFADDYRCWADGESECAENQYPEKKLSAIQSGGGGRPFRGVLPLLVETPVGYLAVAESDVLDWSGLSLTGLGTASVKAVLDRRSEGNGLVVWPKPTSESGFNCATASSPRLAAFAAAEATQKYK
jgi:alpha-glucosidase